MAVIASLVLGADGSSTLGGSSDAITTLVDRERFLIRRRSSDALIIGGNTARNERYRRTPVPLVVVSRSQPEILEQNPLAHWWSVSPSEAVTRAQEEFGERISIEGGVALVSELLDAHLITQLELSITPHIGGANRVNHFELLAHFENVETNYVEETIFYTCTTPIMFPR